MRTYSKRRSLNPGIRSKVSVAIWAQACSCSFLGHYDEVVVVVVVVVADGEWQQEEAEALCIVRHRWGFRFCIGEDFGGRQRRSHCAG